MKITEDHWLENVRRDEIKGASLMDIRRFLVIHHTAGATGQSSIDYWKMTDKGICAHIVVERNGEIIQVRAFNRTCGHAGKSTWVDPNTKKRYWNINSCSIGIELANAGNSKVALSWARKQAGFRSLKLKHKNGSDIEEWEAYTAKQYEVCKQVSKVIVQRYNLDDLIGHEDCSPYRKVDPGPAFPMENLRLSCGFEGLPTDK